MYQERHEIVTKMHHLRSKLNLFSGNGLPDPPPGGVRQGNCPLLIKWICVYKDRPQFCAIIYQERHETVTKMHHLRSKLNFSLGEAPPDTPSRTLPPQRHTSHSGCYVACTVTVYILPLANRKSIFATSISTLDILEYGINTFLNFWTTRFTTINHATWYTSIHVLQ